jgi:hypothetical protein
MCLQLGGSMEQIKRKQITDEEIVCQFMNTDTGEIEYSLREGDSLRVYTKEQKDYTANHKRIKEKGLFVKLHKDVMVLLAREDLSKSEYKIIFIALAYLDKTSGVLIEDGVNISKARFLELTELSHNTFSESVNKLIKLNIMARTKSGRNSIYLMNPFIFQNGTYINATLYRIFKKSKWNTQND